MIEDIRLEPGIARPTAPALVDERPAFAGNADLLGDQAAGFGELVLVLAVSGHRDRDAVRGEGEVHFLPAIAGDSIQGLADALGVGGDEVGVVVEDANLVDRGGTGPTASCARAMSSRYWRQLE